MIQVSKSIEVHAPGIEIHALGIELHAQGVKSTQNWPSKAGTRVVEVDLDAVPCLASATMYLLAIGPSICYLLLSICYLLPLPKELCGRGVSL